MDDIARNLQDALVMLIDEQEAFSDLFPESDMPDVRHVETFEHAGVMTPAWCSASSTAASTKSRSSGVADMSIPTATATKSHTGYYGTDDALIVLDNLIAQRRVEETDYCDALKRSRARGESNERADAALIDVRAALRNLEAARLLVEATENL